MYGNFKSCLNYGFECISREQGKLTRGLVSISGDRDGGQSATQSRDSGSANTTLQAGKPLGAVLEYNVS